MAILTVANANDEISKYQMDLFVSSNEANRGVFSFENYEKYFTVVHLAVHIKNGQLVYYNTGNAVKRAARPPSTTLTSSFSVFQRDAFVRLLLYAAMPRYYTWNVKSKLFQHRKHHLKDIQRYLIKTLWFTYTQ